MTKSNTYFKSPQFYRILLLHFTKAHCEEGEYVKPEVPNMKDVSRSRTLGNNRSASVADKSGNDSRVRQDVSIPMHHNVADACQV